ncbi:hypothetical protein DNTS_020728 [Danionella cerebrum]|uniref:Mitochondrial nucleoid factor 1 n=1 Tax=Danionella cerebrum TaxID=2873325 RepID=A0A553MP65_9TELE|nr:hypothetical protein DNTS_020728 [Danionella translucida]
MSATRYRRFLKLCEEWPKDESKKGRDLGTFLRQRVASAFREGENTQITEPEKCDQMYESLARINSNLYKEKWMGNVQTTDEEKKGLWKTLMERFSPKPEEGPPEKTEK